MASRVPLITSYRWFVPTDTLLINCKGSLQRTQLFATPGRIADRLTGRSGMSRT